MAWDSAGGARPARVEKEGAQDESMFQTVSFRGWEARLSRRLCAEDRTRGGQSFPLFLFTYSWSPSHGLGGPPHTHGLQT